MSDLSNVPPEIPMTAGALPYQMPPMDNPVISAYAIDLLKKMGFWARVFAVVLFVTAGLMMVCGPFVAVFGVIGAAAGRGSPREGAPQMILLGLLYLAMGALYLIPAVYLNRFSGKAKVFSTLKDMGDLEAALSAHKSFWKFLSILVLVVIGLYLLLIPVAIVAGVLASHR